MKICPNPDVSPGMRENIDYVIQIASMIADTTAGAGIPGKMSLNELRIMARLILATARDQDISVSWLAKDLGLPRSSVSTFITKLICLGWLVESIHPEDRRKRILRMSDQTCETIQGWADRVITRRQAINYPMKTLVA